MKSGEIRELIGKVIDVGHELAGTPAGSQLQSTLRKWLGRASWCLVVAVVGVVLADLFLGRYRVVGPWVFGVASGVVGAVAGRAFFRKAVLESRPAPAPAPVVAGRNSDAPEVTPGGGAIFCVLFSGVCCWIGLTSLLGPYKVGFPPEDASIDWSSHRDPKQPGVWWASVRSAQCSGAPIALFFGGGTGVVALGFLSRVGRKGIGQEARAPEPTPTDSISPRPGVLVLIVWVILLLITMRI